MTVPFKSITFDPVTQVSDNVFETSTFDLSEEIPFSLMSCNVVCNDNSGAEFQIGLGSSPSDPDPTYILHEQAFPDLWFGLQAGLTQKPFIRRSTLFLKHKAPTGSKFIVSISFANITDTTISNKLHAESIKIPSGTPNGSSFTLLNVTEKILVKSIYINSQTTTDQGNITVVNSELDQLFPMPIAIGFSSVNNSSCLRALVVVNNGATIQVITTNSISDDTYVYMTYSSI